MRFLTYLCALWLCAVAARAEDSLSKAQTALMAGQYALARSEARTALEAGTRRGVELAPLYAIEARASAMLGDEEAARRAFTTLLALEPGYRPAGEPDEVRSPYMEARGFWSMHAVALEVELERDESGALRVNVADPAGLASRVRVRVRGDVGRIVEFVRPAEARVTLPSEALPAGTSLHYSAALLDEHGNRLLERGSDASPRVLAATSSPAPSAATDAVAPAAPPARKPRLVGGSLSLALGGGALVLAGLGHAERERLAERWNEGECDGAGDTRAERCGDEKSRLDRMQRGAIALYATGAAAVVTGVVLLVLSARREREVERDALACGALARGRGIACTVRF